MSQTSQSSKRSAVEQQQISKGAKLHNAVCNPATLGDDLVVHATT
jgi:hypothetical protein